MAAPTKVAVLLWQVSQARDVGMWPAGFPVADEPLWQLAQPVEMPAWLKAAPANDVVDLWQLSHAAVVATCPADLPVASDPLWQLAHPDAMPA